MTIAAASTIRISIQENQLSIPPVRSMRVAAERESATICMYARGSAGTLPISNRHTMDIA